MKWLRDIFLNILHWYHQAIIASTTNIKSLYKVLSDDTEPLVLFAWFLCVMQRVSSEQQNYHMSKTAENSKIRIKQLHMIRDSKRMTLANIFMMFSIRYHNHQQLQVIFWWYRIFWQFLSASESQSNIVNNYKKLRQNELKNIYWKWWKILRCQNNKNFRNISQKSNYDLRKWKTAWLVILKIGLY